MTRKERLLRIARLHDQAVAKICDIDAHPWRLARNMRLRREVRVLLAECDAEFEAIAEAKAKYGKPGDGTRRLPPGAVSVAR